MPKRPCRPKPLRKPRPTRLPARFPSSVCNNCLNDGVFVCQHCFRAWYCSEGCHKEDWRTHRYLCPTWRSFGIFGPNRRPSPTHVLAILLPMESTAPQLIWLDRGRPESEEYIRFTYFHTFLEANGLGPLPVLSTSPPWDRVAHGNRMVSHRFVDDASMVRPEFVNKCLANLVPSYTWPFFGPVILAVQQPRAEGGGWTDITPRDFRRHLDQAMTEKAGPGLHKPFWLHDSPSIPALVLYNRKDPFIQAVGPGQSIETLETQASAPGTFAITLALFLGLSWYIRDGSSLDDYKGSRPGIKYIPAARYMWYVYVSWERANGSTVRYSRPFDCTGCAVILHARGFPLSVHHVQAFNRYLDRCFRLDEAQPSRAGFAAFWEKYKTRCIRRGMWRLNDVPSPYHFEVQNAFQESVVDPLADELREAVFENMKERHWRMYKTDINEATADGVRYWCHCPFTPAWVAWWLMRPIFPILGLLARFLDLLAHFLFWLGGLAESFGPEQV